MRKFSFVSVVFVLLLVALNACGEQGTPSNKDGLGINGQGNWWTTPDKSVTAGFGNPTSGDRPAGQYGFVVIMRGNGVYQFSFRVADDDYQLTKESDIKLLPSPYGMTVTNQAAIHVFKGVDYQTYPPNWDNWPGKFILTVITPSGSTYEHEYIAH